MAKVGKHEVALTLPKSFSVRLDVVGAAGRNAVRACAAALGVCWQGPGKPKQSLERHGYDVLAYGGAVMDELVAHGATAKQVIDAGREALELISESIPTDEEVTATEGFTEAGTADSTS